MVQTITIEEFFVLGTIPIIDVRTPAEFTKGHIPGAFNVPLFSNEERILIGTTYKKQSREEAILKGFDLVGPKWSGFIKDCIKISPQKRIALHCWRGGMRSAAMAWALDLYGFKVYTIKGGYKSYRAWVRSNFEKPYQLFVLGGMTGSGKTKLLQQMQMQHQQVIDFEELAQHKGSAYGSMNHLVQPSQEQFENNLALSFSQLDAIKPIWVEDECQMIGRCSIPLPLWQQMRQAIVADFQIPYRERVNNLMKEYAVLDKNFLVECTQRISKRLGPLETKLAITAINENQMETFIKTVMVYYDKQYFKGLSKRADEKIFAIKSNGTHLEEDSRLLIDFSHIQQKKTFKKIADGI